MSADPGVVFHFYINPETPTRKHGRVEGGRMWFLMPITYSRRRLVRGLLMFVWSAAASKDVVGEKRVPPFDTAPLCLLNKGACVRS